MTPSPTSSPSLTPSNAPVDSPTFSPTSSPTDSPSIAPFTASEEPRPTYARNDTSETEDETMNFGEDIMKYIKTLLGDGETERLVLMIGCSLK